jgi:hypothetical protein
LDCHKFSENHTSLNFSVKIDSTLKKWNSQTKIILSVSDNTYNIKIALSILQVKHSGCSVHTLNLIVQDALILKSSLLEKNKTIVSFFRRSRACPNSSSKLKWAILKTNLISTINREFSVLLEFLILFNLIMYFI